MLISILIVSKYKNTLLFFSLRFEPLSVTGCPSNILYIAKEAGCNEKKNFDDGDKIFKICRRPVVYPNLSSRYDGNSKQNNAMVSKGRL